MNRKRLVSACGLSLLASLWLTHAVAAEPATLILHHGQIVTVDREFRIAEAMAIVGERILAVGTNAEVLAHQGPETKVMDLQGQMVLPGLIDSHTHPHSAALHEFDHPIPEMESIDDVLAYVRQRAESLPAGQWISISQVFITRLRERRYPTRQELDQAAPEHPVVFSTGPDAMLNSLALKLSGIGRDFQVVGPGKIETDPDTGEPTGLLRNCGRYIKRQSTAKPPQPEERIERLKLLFHDYNSVGLTTIADRNAGREDILRYQQMHADGALSVRVMCSHALNAQEDLPAIQSRLQEIAALPACQPNPWVRVIGVKTFLDGGMLTGSAFLREPWGVSAIYSITDPQYRGILFIEPGKLTEIVRATAEQRLQFTAHSVGDGAVQALLEAYEKLAETMPIHETRPCLTHSNFMSADAGTRMAKLGVVADIQPAWLYLDARTLSEQFGDTRLRYFQPLRTLFEQGAIIGGGSDHMQKIGSLRSVNPYNPFLGMWVTLTRQARWFEGALHPEEALTREQMLRFYTSNNAHLLFLEQQVGSLEAGKLADFVVIDRDLLQCPVAEIRDTQVRRTVVHGRQVYERPAAAP